jgi:hypothetical protein
MKAKSPGARRRRFSPMIDIEPPGKDIPDIVGFLVQV